MSNKYVKIILQSVTFTTEKQNLLQSVKDKSET